MENYFTTLCCFLPYMNQPQVYTVSPPSWTPLLLSSPPCPLGSLLSTSFGCSASCTELALVIYFIYGNVQICILSNHPYPRLSPSWVQKSVLLHLYLLCCPECRIVDVSSFLNSCIFALIYSVCLSFTYFTLYIRLQVHPIGVRNYSNVFLLIAV